MDVLDTRYVFVPPCSSALSLIYFLTSVRKNGPNDFTLLVASANPHPETGHDIKCQDADAKLTVEYGDFAKPLQKAVAALKEVTCYLLL